MAMNGVNNEDADMAECDGEKVVTMMDVLQEEQDFEEDANAVLGASDEKDCTYSKGYIKRQAIYACLTCCTEAKDDPTKRAGFCLACSLNCHENHDLIELYTKRNFRCDCGNPKFNSHPCQFTPDKTDFNADNKYNQNFSGLYCNCHRPYPDPESTVEDDEMIQCIICEDWLHASHLDAAVPSNDQYSEMVCKTCMENNDFLHDYSNLTVNIETGDVDVIAANGDILSNGDLETEKLMNGSGDSNKICENEMEIEEGQVESAATDIIITVEKEDSDHQKTDSEKKLENEKADSKDPAEENESNVALDAEKTESCTQITTDLDSKMKDDTNTATSLEESTNENTDEKKSSELSESNDISPENVEIESENTTEATSEPEVTKQSEEKVEADFSEIQKTEEDSDSTENKELLEANIKVSEIETDNEKEDEE